MALNLSTSQYFFVDRPAYRAVQKHSGFSVCALNPWYWSVISWSWSSNLLWCLLMMLWKVIQTLESVDKSWTVTSHMKATAQNFPSMLIIWTKSLFRVARKVFLNTCKAKLWYGINTAEKYKMDFFLVYGMEISLAQPNVSLIKLASSSRGIIFVLFG